jgi:ABC-2 type transport system permease protein
MLRGRLLRSELRLVFGRRRNQVLLVVTALFPVAIGIALRVAAPHGGAQPSGPNQAPVLYNQLAGNGVFLSFVALSTLLLLVLPIVVTVVAGDSIAGEAGYGTLRYLLTVPAGRARLLGTKLATAVIFALAATVIVSVVALIVGVILFPVGPVTLLSGAAAMAMLAALGLAVSTVTEHALAAIAGLVVAVVTSEVADSIPQLAPIAPYLPTHWWLSFDAFLRAPADTGTVVKGLASFGVYLVLAVAFAWARFTTADVTS